MERRLEPEIKFSISLRHTPRERDYLRWKEIQRRKRVRARGRKEKEPVSRKREVRYEKSTLKVESFHEHQF